MRLTASLQTKVTRLPTTDLAKALANRELDIAEILPTLVTQNPKQLPAMRIVEANYRPVVTVVATTEETRTKWSFEI